MLRLVAETVLASASQIRHNSGMCPTYCVDVRCQIPQELSPMSEVETAMLIKVLSGAAVLFVIAYIGNLLTFSNRLVNALVTAIIFGIVNAGLFYAIDMATLPDNLQDLSQQTWFQMVLMAAAMVFVIDLVANIISFNNRFTSALVTAVVFAVLYGILFYVTGGLPEPVIPA